MAVAHLGARSRATKTHRQADKFIEKVNDWRIASLEFSKGGPGRHVAIGIAVPRPCRGGILGGWGWGKAEGGGGGEVPGGWG
jgi:hypothetical protein